jgi:hypothetical protein
LKDQQMRLSRTEKFRDMYYKIAGHWILVYMPAFFHADSLLPAFIPFGGCPPPGTPVLCGVEALPGNGPYDGTSGQLLSDVPGVLGDRLRLRESEEHYVFDLYAGHQPVCYQMVSRKDFSDSKIYLPGHGRETGEVLSAFLMIVFAQRAVMYRTMLVHASVVEHAGAGYAFLGKSGTGKSTHSALWIRYIANCSLLNDDNPSIRIEADGRVTIYGTPWSGKTPCYQQRGVPLRGIVRLEQAPHNRFRRMEGTGALITLLPSCFSMRWNKGLYAKLCDELEYLVGQVPVGYLECMPDKAAAMLCYDGIAGKQAGTGRYGYGPVSWTRVDR